MRQVFRPFSKIVRVETSDDTDTEVTLLDSSGNNLKCNYISVQASGVGGAATDFLRVIPVIEGSAEHQFNTPSEDMFNISTSGTCCVFTAEGGPPADMMLSDSDRTDTLRIAKTGGGGGAYVAIITYGQVQSSGALRDKFRPGGV